MSSLAAPLVLGAIVVAVLLVVPAARRTGLGPWHPAIAWIGLELVFFGLGSAILAVVDGRPGPALYVAGCVLAFASAVAAGDRVASRRSLDARETRQTADRPPPATIRPVVVAGLAVLGIVVLLPTLAGVGIPFLVNDITGARSEIGGLELQVLRVALPAAVLVAVIQAIRADARRARGIALVAVAIAVAAELALASRYLAAELVAGIVLGLAIAGRPIPGRALAAIGLVGAVLFVSVGVLRAYDQAAGRELAFAAERTVNRIVLIQPRTLDALQATIPAEEPFFGGLTWLRRLGPVVGRDDIPNIGYWIYPRLFPGQVTPGYAAPGLVGEAWANLGVFGLALFAALGIVVERLGALIARRRAATADIVFSALATLFIARTHAVGLNGLIVLATLVIGWRLLVAPIGDLLRDLRLAAAWRI